MRSLMFYMLLVDGLMLAALGFALALPVQARGDTLPLDEPTKPAPAVDFQAYTPDGTLVRLSDYQGKVVLLNFWATWCPPCKYELPAFETLHRELAGKPFQLVAVDVGEDAAKVKAFLERHGYTFQVLLDPANRVGGLYGASDLPLTYLIDKDGNVVRRAIGARDWDSEAARALLAELMEVPPVAGLLSFRAGADQPAEGSASGAERK